MPDRDRPDSAAATVAVFGDVNLNLIDGSSVWLVSLCSVLDRLEISGHVLLKAGVEREVLTRELDALGRFRVWGPRDLGEESPLGSDSLVRALRRIDGEVSLDAVIVRGFRAAEHAATSGSFDGRLWPYLTDIPQTSDAMNRESALRLRRILEASGRVLCQTESLRSFLARYFPDFDRKMVLLPPMVADGAFAERKREWADGGLRLLYAGKFAPLWGIEEMVAQVQVVRKTHPDVGLTVAGDKFHQPPSDPGYPSRVRDALQGEGVDWLGGVGRGEVIGALAEADLALSVRDIAVNESRELSTKVLEYAAAQVPPVVNRTLAHEEILGSDYPLFVEGFDDMHHTIEPIAEDPELLESISSRLRGIATRFSFAATAGVLKPIIAAARSNRSLEGRRILVAGHDLKFTPLLLEGLQAAGAEIRVDAWVGHGEHDEQRSRTLLDWADSVLCEWSLGNAVWYSRHKRPGQRLWVRFHRVELDFPWPRQIDFDAVDKVVFVGEHVLREAVARFGWEEDRLTVIPNTVDEIALDRPKLPGAGSTLGMLGYLPELKRLDVALDILELLRGHDDRFRLVLKGKLPWELPWMWRTPSRRAYFEHQFERIRTSPLLGEAVTFDPAAGDVPSWFRKVGFVLSPSDIESFHLALVEGMAARSVPVVLDRPGAASIVAKRWVSSDPTDAAERIVRLDGASWLAAGEEARQEVVDRYGLGDTLASWRNLLA